ncbi:patatin-like phospholipase family protein [Consotaella aegiceratis]|uniref:patatin-like phospholipase family protein n=1 Tax=Consotaella aegiceratis TaxID=3097961 RepID=UPI002F416F88
MSADPIALALGGGGARGLAHIHVLEALDDLGVKPTAIAGSSIGAIIGAAYAAGMSGAEIRDYALANLTSGQIASRLWRTRPPNFSEFFADGGFRLGQLNAKRVLTAFLPGRVPASFEDLTIPLIVVATDFYAGRECAIDTGDLMVALAASAGIPALFRPVSREGAILIDGGITNPLPFDLLQDKADFVVAVDVTGGPEGDPGQIPTPLDAMFGASQLMMQSIIETKLKIRPPDLLVRPAVSGFGVLDFFKAPTILAATQSAREEVKRAVAARLETIDGA